MHSAEEQQPFCTIFSVIFVLITDYFMSLFLIRKLIAHTIHLRKQGYTSAFFQQMMLVCDKCTVCPEFVDMSHILHCLDVNMRVDHHIFHMVLYEKVLPHSQAEAIVKDDYFLFRQNFAEPSVSLHIELFQNLLETWREPLASSLSAAFFLLGAVI